MVCISLTFYFRFIISSIPYIDRSRVAVMGTNYGGFVASMVMAQTDLVRCGVLTSPVTDWIHYGNILG